MKTHFTQTERKAIDVQDAWYELKEKAKNIDDSDIVKAMANLFGEIILLSDMVFADNQEVVEFTESEMQD